MQPIGIDQDFIEEEDGKAARAAAIKYWKDKYPNGVSIDTRVGTVLINAKGIKHSLSHGFGRRKLAAIPTLEEGMRNASYIGSLSDFDDKGIKNHFFLYKLDYKEDANYVICRIRDQFEEKRLYIHEVAPITSFAQKKSDSLLSQPADESHLQLRGIALYEYMITDFLQGVNGEFYPLQKEEKNMPDQKAAPELPNAETEELFSDNELSAAEMDEYHKWLEEEQQNADMYHQEISDSLTVAEESLDDNAIKELRGIADDLHTSMKNVEEAREELSGQEEDAGERDRLEARLGALRRLKRLSGSADEEGLLTYCQEASLNLEWLEKSYPKLEELTGESLKLRKRANALAMELRRSRQEAAAALSQRVNALLKDLAMEGTSFELHLRELGKLRRDGADEAEFALRDGTRVGRVDKIASGGELSRLLLALQLSLPQEWTPPTLVFDEVEAGLGGRAAVLSGMKLKELSRNAQVILVTHEASIAALGDAHVLIQRAGGESQIEPIEGEARVREIARMLSGSPDLTEAQEHARKLLTEGPW